MPGRSFDLSRVGHILNDLGQAPSLTRGNSREHLPGG